MGSDERPGDRPGFERYQRRFGARGGPDPAADLTTEGDGPTGPVPQGAPPDGVPPSGPSPTGHPSDSSEDPSAEGSRAGSIWDDLGAAVGAERREEESVVDQSSSADESVPLSDEDVVDGEVPDDQSLSADDEAVLRAEEAVLADVAKLAAERDDYLDQLQRLKADFDNYRKRILRQQTEHLERAAEGLVEKLLDTFDTFEAALAHGEGFDQVHGKLMGVLEKEGLERIDPAGKPFSPEEADAVAHEEGDGGPTVIDVLRPGYRWKGRVLRPAMVRVRG